LAGEKGRRIRELTSVVQKRFQFPEGTVELYAEKVNNRGLCAIAQAESLRYKLLGGLAVRRSALVPELVSFISWNQFVLWNLLCRPTCQLFKVARVRFRVCADVFYLNSRIFRACYGVLRFIMESGAKGCEVISTFLLSFWNRLSLELSEICSTRAWKLPNSWQ
jgi:hypothetical protein